ncbi:MAG TPA: YqgE/AlgH family protein [Terriglobia bacterium]|nr:YqgE/AlgH family protein [Terriglobia bacterium]
MPSLAGSFLIARPVLKDPNFQHAVVLLLQHDEDGAFGLVINRPQTVEGIPYPVFFGGPCKIQGLLMLHGHETWKDTQEEQSREVCPGVYLGDPTSFEKVADPEPGEELRFRMFSGYSGWGPSQLERELAEGSWAVVPATSQVIFDMPSEHVWQHLVPPSIPQPSVN